MIPWFMLLLLFADASAEHRARAAVDAAVAAEKNAEAAYAKGDMETVKAELRGTLDQMEAAHGFFAESRKTPGRNPGPYKYAEQRSRELLVRLGDLERKMDVVERELVEAPKARIQEIHDDWFEGIMGKKK
jgi:hypothetical protein